MARKKESKSANRLPRTTAATGDPIEASEGKGRSRSSAVVAKLPIRGRPRAFDLLSRQPNSLAGLSQAERDVVVVAAVADDLNNEYPVCRIGDSTWDLSSEPKAKNKASCELKIDWPADVPDALINDAKAASYYALRRGPHGKPWSATTVINTARDVFMVLRHFASLGILNFGQVRALHLSDLIAEMQKKIKPHSIRSRLVLIDVIWRAPQEVFHPLIEHPWGDDGLNNACGCNDDRAIDKAGRTAKTAVIPRSAQRKLFSYCEARLESADALFRKRDAGELSPYAYALTKIRDSVLYLIEITSGMRNSEATGIRNNCWRSERRNGITFNWVQTQEIKTRKGLVDYLVPPEAIQALILLQRFAEPYQQRLADEARWLEALLHRGDVPEGMTFVEAVQRLNDVNEIRDHLFLGLDSRYSDHLGTGSRVNALSENACCVQLKALAEAAGAGMEWPSLANHQCRRTFAYNVANSRLGRMGLVFLKWQLKHSSLSWTQLYAANPRQDQTLYGELQSELIAVRAKLMEGWMRPDAPLSGGAGRQLMLTRVTPVRNMENLLQHTAEVINLRSTGHGWCLSGTRGCKGQGVYDPGRCAGCSHSVIDGSHGTTWQMIHLDNLRLAAIDCGPAVAQKAHRAIRRSEQVLSDLGIALPSAELAEAYKGESIPS
ncbi:integrase [Cupriavidus metallidurans]|uniref:integrase n=1 Tax=Cupriavidus metallidurans TaxID=119219 RepID=UPI000AE74072|nr:integrase [Cupriavidus metallidurans]